MNTGRQSSLEPFYSYIEHRVQGPALLLQCPWHLLCSRGLAVLLISAGSWLQKRQPCSRCPQSPSRPAECGQPPCEQGQRYITKLLQCWRAHCHLLPTWCPVVSHKLWLKLNAFVGNSQENLALTCLNACTGICSEGLALPQS